MSHRFVARSSLGGACHGAPGFAKLAGRGSGAHRVPSVDRARGSCDDLAGRGSGAHRVPSINRARGSFCEPAPCTAPMAVKSGLAIGHAPVHDAPWHHRPGKRARSQDAFPSVAEGDALRRRSLMVSKSITSFARYPDRRPAGVVPAGDGSLDVDQLWVCWGRRCGFSRTQLLQHIADHAISDSGRRRFLLHSDHDGRTWVTVAAPLRRMPRRHRRARPMSRPSHISVSSEDDFVDDDQPDVSADIQGLHEEDPTGDSADPDFRCEDVVSGDLVSDQDVKQENEVKTEKVPVDDGALPPTVLDVGSQSCKDEPQDPKEVAMSSAQVFTQSVPSLSPVSTVDSRALSPPPGQTPDFREDSPSPPFNVTLASRQLGCPDPSPTSSPQLSHGPPCSPPHPSPTSPSSPCSVTPTVPCLRGSLLAHLRGHGFRPLPIQHFPDSSWCP